MLHASVCSLLTIVNRLHSIACSMHPALHRSVNAALTTRKLFSFWTPNLTNFTVRSKLFSNECTVVVTRQAVKDDLVNQCAVR
jgi:hypothetical protein